MRADPLAVGALTICSIAWLLTATLLTLGLLGRLPGARRRNARAYRLQQTAGLVLMTVVVLSQVASLAHWADPIRQAINILTMLAGIGMLVVVIKVATIMSEAKRAQATPDASPSS